MRFPAHLLAVMCVLTCVSGNGKNENEADAKKFLADYNEAAVAVFRNYTLREWDVVENDSLPNRNNLRIAGKTKDKFMRDMRARALKFKVSGMSKDTQRQISKIKNIGIAALGAEPKATALSTFLTLMDETVSNAKYCNVPELSCDYNQPGVLTPNLPHKFLSTLWTSWRKNTGAMIKDVFSSYVSLSNEAVKLTGFKDLGEQWLSRYETQNFKDELKLLYNQIRPLYVQLHAFVRKTLKKTYRVWIPKTGQIPAHVLGNMMADEWSKIFPYIAFNGSSYDLKLRFKQVGSGDLLDMADDFLVSLGFEKMDKTFYKESIVYSKKQAEQAGFRALVFDFFDQKDFRLAGPSKVDDIRFYDDHNKLTQIQYFRQYKNQSVVYREPANDAFLDAIGGAIELSVRNLDYLKNMSLLKPKHISPRMRINYQLMLALEKIPLLPFAYVVDEWRWSVFNGSTTPENYNKVWWNLRCYLQGVSPPVNRSDKDFDPGAVLEIAKNQPYIKHFISTLLQFQIYRRMCIVAKHKGPLHTCSLENNTEVGDKLRTMMKLGSSVHWKTALRELTGQARIQAKPMLEYFQPLLESLKKKNGKFFGWNRVCDKEITISG